jgi:hypothetical protein
MASGRTHKQPSDVRLGDLRPIAMSAHLAARPDLRKLTDDELLKSVIDPALRDGIVVNTRTGLLHDGNGRTLELLRRASDPNSKITADTLVPVEYYTPDLSMFPDIEPLEENER